MAGKQQGRYAQELALVRTWAEALGEVEQRIGERFARSEAREGGRGYLRGLLSPVERKNSWQLAEALGEPTPYRLQHLLGRALWDADRVRDDLQQHVLGHLGNDEAILVVDETGFLKKGRQYSGTAGRVENCQIGVFLAYASTQGDTLIDQELYLPREWTDDPARCARAGIPTDRALPLRDASQKTKPVLARRMLERAFQAGVPAAWVTGDSVYGDDRRLRLWLEEREQAYVLAVSGKEYVWIGFKQQRVSKLLAALPDEGWTRLSAGEGAKGPRWYDWQAIPLNVPLQEGWRRWLLVRRKVDDPTERTAYVIFAPQATGMETLVRVAGSRWAIEVTLEAAKGEVGLDQYEVQSWTGWYRHVTLAMWAHALLAVLRAASLKAEALQKGALLPAHLARCPSGSSGSLEAFKRSQGLWSG